MARISDECPRRLLLDDDECVQGGGGIGRGDDAAGLGADGDGRDVVGDRVVELAGQLLALEELDLVHPAGAGLVLVADGRADRGRDQQDQKAGDQGAGRYPVGRRVDHRIQAAEQRPGSR